MNRKIIFITTTTKGYNVIVKVTRTGHPTIIRTFKDFSDAYVFKYMEIIKANTEDIDELIVGKYTKWNRSESRAIKYSLISDNRFKAVYDLAVRRVAEHLGYRIER